MKKPLKTLLAGTFITTFVLLAILITIIFFPEPLFANRLEYRQFKVYANEEITNDIQPILDSVISLISYSELYDTQSSYDIFFCHNTFFNKIDDFILGHGPSARATDNNVVVKVDVDLKQDKFFPTFFEKCEGNLTFLLSHEVVHCLQEGRYGKLKFNPVSPPEMWKLEGYPEYIAHRAQRVSEAYNLKHEIDRFIELENTSNDGWIATEDGGCKSPMIYYKSRLMTEYLMDVRGFTYDEILKDTTSEIHAYHELLLWLAR